MVSNMDWVCTECGRSFTNKESYCENWREPDRKFGCPHCHTFYRRARRKSRWQEGVLQFAAMMLMIIAMNSLFRAFRTDDVYYTIIMSVILLLICIIQLLYFSIRKRTSEPAIHLEKIITTGAEKSTGFTSKELTE